MSNSDDVADLRARIQGRFDDEYVRENGRWLFSKVVLATWYMVPSNQLGSRSRGQDSVGFKISRQIARENASRRLRPRT